MEVCNDKTEKPDPCIVFIGGFAFKPTQLKL